MKLQLVSYEKRGSNGDRDPTRKLYYDYDVVAILDGKSHVLRHFDGYDYFWTTPAVNRKAEALQYLREQAEAFEAEILPERRLRPKPPEPRDPEWEEY